MSKDTAERILKAGVACFAKSGYSGTSTRTLAAAAGVNVATLAYHFKGKEGLYKAAIDYLFEQVFAVQPEGAFPFDAPAEERVELVVRFAYRFAREHNTGVRLLLRHVIEHGHLPSRVREGWNTQLLERAELLWGLMGLGPDPDWKLKLLTINHLLSRFAITDAADLLPFVDTEDPHQAVEDHLVRLAIRVLMTT